MITAKDIQTLDSIVELEELGPWLVNKKSDLKKSDDTTEFNGMTKRQYGKYEANVRKVQRKYREIMPKIRRKHDESAYITKISSTVGVQLIHVKLFVHVGRRQFVVHVHEQR